LSEGKFSDATALTHAHHRRRIPLPPVEARSSPPPQARIRESGSIEQDADVVAFIFREEVYKRDREDLRGMAELLVSKQRNGPVGKIDLVFLHHLTKFENRAEDLGDVEG
jgi:replicative DNA helicase